MKTKKNAQGRPEDPVRRAQWHGLKERLYRAMIRSQDYVNAGHLNQFLLSIPAGIGLFVATGLAGRLFAVIVMPPKTAPKNTVILNGIPLSDAVIGVLSVAVAGGIIGMVLYLLFLTVYYWFKE